MKIREYATRARAQFEVKKFMSGRGPGFTYLVSITEFGKFVPIVFVDPGEPDKAAKLDEAIKDGFRATYGHVPTTWIK